MTHVHYKFSSKLSYDTVVFDGPHITLRDLKRQIMGREKLRAGDCDLQITNAQTKEEYTDDEGLIPKGSSVIVRRIPIIGVKSSSNSKTRNIERSDVPPHHAFGAIKAMDDQSSSRASPLFSKMANLADADVSEEDKIKVMINQSNYDSMNYSKKFGAVLPVNYTCYRCGNTGHHIRNCPTSGQDKTFEGPPRLKKSTGIPRSFMVEVDDPNIKGAMLTNSGHYAIPALHAKAYAIGKKEKPPFIPQEQPKAEDKEDPVPDELICLICRDLLSDAVVIPCCGNSYCDDCIRTALLDSEDHVCPTCSLSDVSPDTLIANKFLRQAVNTFKKERGHTKSLTGRCSNSQSQNPTPTPSPVPTPPPLTMQSQPQKPHQPTHVQLDPLLQNSQAADAPPSSKVCEVPPTAAGPTSASDTPSVSLQPVQSHLDISDKDTDRKTHDESAAAAPSVLVSHKDSTAASHLIPLVNPTPLGEQHQTLSVNLQQSSSGPTQKHQEPSTSWDSSASSSLLGCPPGGWSETNTQHPPPYSSSSSYPATPAPLFPSPHFHTYLATQQPINSYPPGYPPATPIWTVPTPQGAPIPSHCSSTSASPIASLIPKEWYLHQRKKNERSPHRGSTYRRSSSRSNSKSSKSKSSRSYSRSSSRSRSRSRSKSQGRSRPHSSYSRHRDHHSRSHSSHSYSYGYKRSPTPSSSSSPRVGYPSRSKSPLDYHKSSHRSRHHNKKSTSSSCSSGRRGERPRREGAGSERSASSYLDAQSTQTSSLELDRQRYLQWKREYEEWCEKYFKSYVGHFHQLPPPLLSLPPSPLPHWEAREEGRKHSTLTHTNSPPHKRLQGRCSAQMDDRSLPLQSSSDSRSTQSQSSSDSRSTPSHCSSDSRSTPSQSSSDSRSSPSHSSNDSRSPPFQLSSAHLSTPSEDGAQPGANRQSPPIALKKGADLQERRKDEKQSNTEKSKDSCTLKHEQKSVKKQEKGRVDEPSSPDAADSTDDCRKNKRRHDPGPHACRGGTSGQDQATVSKALESVQPLMKSAKRLDNDCERKSREQRELEKEKGWRRGKYSDSREDLERRHKEKPRKGADRVDTDSYKHPEGSKASDFRSEKNRKRKGEDEERSPIEAQSSKSLETKVIGVTRKSESPNPFERKKPKTERSKERKTWPLTEQDIWEGGTKVRPQTKISININLDGKRTKEKSEEQDLAHLESFTGKPKEEINKAGNEEEGNSNKEGTEIIEKKESSREQKGVSEEKVKPVEGEVRPKWKSSFRDDTVWEKKGAREEKEEEDFDLWHCALRGVEEGKAEVKKQWEEVMEASREEKVMGDEKRSIRYGEKEESRARNDGGRAGTGVFVTYTQTEREKGESTCKEKRGNLPGESAPKEELVEEVKWRMKREEDMMRSRSQKSQSEGRRDRPNTKEGDGSGCDERKTAVKTLEEYTRDRQDELVLVQVPRSRWEKEESEQEEPNEGEIRAHEEAPAAFLPSSAAIMTATAKETEGEHEQQRRRDIEREKSSTLSSSHGRVAPSSGKARPDGTLSRGRWVEVERQRDRESGRERHKESRRSEERSREGGRGRDRERQREHGSIALVLKRNPPSSAHSYVMSPDGHRGCDMGSKMPSSGRSSESGTVSREVPDLTANKTHRDKDRSRSYHGPQDPPGNYEQQDTPSISHSWGEKREPVPSESSGGFSGSSHGRDSMQIRGRNESKVGKGEWKQNKVDKVTKEGLRANAHMVAEREGGSQWEDVSYKLDGLTGWERGRELEEGERPSSNSISSSGSQDSSSSSSSSSSSDDARRNEWLKKEKKHKREKSQPASELLEEREQVKHKHARKTSKTGRDGRGEERGREGDDGWRKEGDCTKLCPAGLF